MTRPQLYAWALGADTPSAGAVAALFAEVDAAAVLIETLRLDLRLARADLASQERECTRLRKASLPQAPWEAEEEVPM